MGAGRQDWGSPKEELGGTGGLRNLGRGAPLSRPLQQGLHFHLCRSPQQESSPGLCNLTVPSCHRPLYPGEVHAALPRVGQWPVSLPQPRLCGFSSPYPSRASVSLTGKGTGLLALAGLEISQRLAEPQCCAELGFQRTGGGPRDSCCDSVGRGMQGVAPSTPTHGAMPHHHSQRHPRGQGLTGTTQPRHDTCTHTDMPHMQNSGMETHATQSNHGCRHDMKPHAAHTQTSSETGIHHEHRRTQTTGHNQPHVRYRRHTQDTHNANTQTQAEVQTNTQKPRHHPPATHWTETCPQTSAQGAYTGPVLARLGHVRVARGGERLRGSGAGHTQEGLSTAFLLDGLLGPGPTSQLPGPPALPQGPRG